MITFKCSQDGSNWQVARQNRLVAYFSTKHGAVAAATGYARQVIKHGGLACVQIANREVRSALPRYAAPLSLSKH